LVRLIADLYAASSDNRAFLHARFAPGENPVKAYKDVVTRWVYPDVFKHQDVSAAKAKNAIADYRKARGDTQGLVDLMARRAANRNTCPLFSPLLLPARRLKADVDAAHAGCAYM